MNGGPALTFISQVSSFPNASPKKMPMMPPMPVSVAASTRNWKMMSPRRAPSALRTPISRVRLVTETIMIAITPMPPTRSPTPESEIITT